MDKSKMSPIGTSWQGVIQWGGGCLLAAGAILVAFILIVIVSGQTLPVPAREALEAPAVPTFLFLMVAIGELLLMPGALALYVLLREVNKTPMVIATALWMTGVPLFLASRGLIIAISQLSAGYLAADSEVVRTAYLVTSQLAIEVQSVFALMALSLVSIASIFIGTVMRSSVLGRGLGYTAIAAGSCSLLGIFIFMGAPALIAFPGLILAAVWQTVAGFKLYRMAAVNNRSVVGRIPVAGDV